MLKPTNRQRQIQKLHDAQERRFIRRFGEWRLIWMIGIVTILLTMEAERSNPYIFLLPAGIMLWSLYKRYFPTESVYDDGIDANGKDRLDSLSADTQSAPDAPTPQLKNALGPVADDLHEIEKRLLDNMATSRVAGPGYIDAMRKFSATRSGLIERVKSARKNPDRRTRRRREPRSE